MQSCVYIVTPIFTPSSTRSDVVLPLSMPIHNVNGHKIYEIAIPKNTNIFLYIWNLNCDPTIWGDDAAKWRPERWLAPLPETVEAAKIQVCSVRNE